MKRELSIERRDDHFHLRFHKYMGPWEGHQIEHVLDLEEVEPPPDGEHYEQVLGPNQAYMWHEMSPDPELHALVTADRLETLAAFVRDRDVTVIEGAELLPEPPAQAHVHYEVKDDTPDGSYVALIEKRHASVWERGPKAVIGALSVRLIPALLIVFVIVVASRHYGDKSSAVSIDEFFARAQRPAVEQGFVDGLLSPDFSHLVRNEIRSVSFASGNRMLLGDGNYLVFDGVTEVMPWLNCASMNRTPITIEASTADAVVRVLNVRCGGNIVGRDLTMRRIAKLPPGDTQPPRTASRTADTYRILDTMPVGSDDGALLEDYVGDRLSLTGVLANEDSRLVLRASDGSGVVIETRTPAPKMRTFLEVFTGDPGPVTVDFEFQRVYPWTDRQDATRARESTRLAGEALLLSASAQNYHVHARR